MITVWVTDMFGIEACSGAVFCVPDFRISTPVTSDKAIKNTTIIAKSFLVYLGAPILSALGRFFYLSELLMIKYLNRLSDLLFVWSRKLAQVEKTT
jgi:hypothetical protein